jgi:Fe-S oxidoreductase
VKDPDVTITYDPHHDLYYDQADVRRELARVLNVCSDCRRCVDACSVFPTAFSLIDAMVTPDAGMMTPEQQDDVSGRCYQCKLCYLDCPYVPGRNEYAIDFPRLMLRVSAMRRHSGLINVRDRLNDAVLNSTDRVGKAGTAVAWLANKTVAGPAGSISRKILRQLAGVSSVQVLPPFAKQRFSTWFNNRKENELDSGPANRSVVVFPTCTVEYHEPAIGKDLVSVYEHNNIGCSLPSSVGCCGAPFLHSGDVENFVTTARKQVQILAEAVRDGNDIVVPQPTCSYVMKKEYVEYLKNPSDENSDDSDGIASDAELVALHTFDSSEYLVAHDGTSLGDKSDGALATDFVGDLPSSITFHASCHMRAQHTDDSSERLLRLLGVDVDRVDACAGIDGLWGLKARHDALSTPVTAALVQSIKKTKNATVSGDCHLANVAVTGQLGTQPLHPMQVLARAYGLSEAGPNFD